VEVQTGCCVNCCTDGIKQGICRAAGIRLIWCSLVPALNIRLEFLSRELASRKL
jgi:hypothetical protein